MGQTSFQDDLTSFIRDSATGDLLITATMLEGWLADGARDVLSHTPVQKLWASASESSLTTATGATITTRKILGVTRYDGNFERPARQIPFLLEGRASDKEDTQFAIKEDPVFFLKDQVLKVLPVPTSTASAKIHSITYPTPSATNTVISGFEDDAELLVRQYMKVQAKYREMGDARRLAQTENEAAITSIETDDLELAASRAQTAAEYLNQAAQAKGEADILQTKYEKDRTEYANG